MENTFGNMSCHMDDRVSVVDNNVLSQSARFAGNLDIVTYTH